MQYPRSVYRCRASPGQSTVTAVHYYRDNGTVQNNRTAVTVDWSVEVRQRYTLPGSTAATATSGRGHIGPYTHIQQRTRWLYHNHQPAK